MKFSHIRNYKGVGHNQTKDIVVQYEVDKISQEELANSATEETIYGYDITKPKLLVQVLGDIIVLFVELWLCPSSYS